MSDFSLSAINDRISEVSGFVKSLRDNLNQIIIGQEKLIDKIIICMLADGHMLLEGVPGLAKTLTVKTLAASIDTNFQRIQFTPDMLPADLIGTLIYNQKSGEFDTRKGPIFSNIILADEINRSPAKVQSALLEAMQEKQVTIGDDTMKLEKPFIVLATQNPIDQEGTYPLPEAQTDRFMLKVLIDYPSMDEEKIIMKNNLKINNIDIKPVVSINKILNARKIANEVYMDEKIEDYILNIIFCTRNPEKFGLNNLCDFISFGASPRASINLAKACKCLAFIKRRGYVIPEDVKEMCYDVLRHRIGLTYEAEAENISTDQIIEQILNKIEVP